MGNILNRKAPAGAVGMNKKDPERIAGCARDTDYGLPVTRAAVGTYAPFVESRLLPADCELDTQPDQRRPHHGVERAAQPRVDHADAS